MSKILVVDDEEHIRFLYSEELNEAGCNGLDLLHDIRNHFYDMPVILSTAYDTFTEDMKSIEADSYVVKNFDLTELKNKIPMALETRVPTWQIRSLSNCTSQDE